MAHAYEQFIQGKIATVTDAGFEPTQPINEKLFDWQRELVKWSIRRGRAALWEDCGLGKTAQQLEWAKHVQTKTGGTYGKHKKN